MSVPPTRCRRRQPPLARSVPLSRFTSRVGGGSAFYVRLLDTFAMNQAPIEIDGARLICFAEITDAIGPTAKTTHSRGAEILGPARGLAICQFAGDSQFHLFYCDEDWTVLTDTCHMTLDEAKDQAQFEYDGISKCWRWAQAA